MFNKNTIYFAVVIALGMSSLASAQRTVTLTLNTATLPDTTNPASLVEVRGAVGGAAPFDLPDGNVIDWSAATTLEPENLGGDYWQTSFQIPDESELQFKFFSDQAETSSAGIGGWEDGDNVVLAAGTGDTTLPLHYFVKGAGQPYDWRPFESKEDTIAVWFRVYMNTEGAATAGYDRGAGQTIGLRGDDFTMTGPLDWGTTKVTVSPESETEGVPAYHLWSGVAYYPSSLAGMTQAYKFFVAPDGWEGTIDNRTFTIPAQDTTLHFVYFDNSAPVTGSGPETATLLFAVDLSPMEAIGIFDVTRGDTLEVRGAFNGWDCPIDEVDTCLLERIPGENTFEAAIPATAIPGSEQGYKFYLNLNDQAFMDEFGDFPPQGWEEPLSTTGANRTFEFEGNPNVDQDLGVQFFNDIYPANIVPDGVTIDITFTVDMTEAINDPAEPFDPGTDSVTVYFGGDQIWAFTQNVPRQQSGDRNYLSDAGFFLLTPTGEGNVYSGVFTLRGPTYAGIQYQYAYGGSGQYVNEAGGSTAGLGRRRTRFVHQNADGSWPAAWEFEAENYQPSGNLPFEENPAVTTSVEPIGSEIPNAISLGDNYPNPFNPSTTFEYSIDATTRVNLAVYDLTGRLVRTLVDGVQPAASYRVGFNAEGLASGVYMYQLKTAERTISKRMVLLK
ncbi:MAG TPA: T9SS type A sorting domain-containing protein [Rhodothermales bacterium]|nr:T9SS type A sorting domain-containing protein [Rhodothermales bacterium]